jgi:4-hydroxybenzoate polyprenyltransferase
LTFNIANQRLENSVLEDAINKPYRPLPSKRISADEARYLLLILIPAGLAISTALGGLKETVAMLVLTWMYNDLGGADEDFRLRNLINACGFICHGSGSTLIAAGFGSYALSKQAEIWLVLTGAVIFTTLQVQDLPDMKGDAVRGRRTLPLVCGEGAGRWSVAIPVLIWSIICPYFWGLGVLSYAFTLVSGFVVSGRVLAIRNEAADEVTYKIWCLWLISLYVLPLFRSPDIFRVL